MYFQYIKNLSLIILCFLFIEISSIKTVKVYPVSNQNFDQIYIIKDGNQIQYLHISCKQENMLSISLSNQLKFHEHPRYPVFGQNQHSYHSHSKIEIPRMQRNIYTFLSFCNVVIEVAKSDTDQKIIQVKRKYPNNEQPTTVFTLKSVTRNPGHNIIVTQDKSTKWGMGQRFQKKFSIQDGLWTIYNRDRPWQIDRGSSMKSGQTYGHQPVYLARNPITKLYHMVYFKNTYGLNLQSKDQSSQLTYHSIGGNIHFILLLGSQNPQQLIKHYHSYIGTFHTPPFWSLGWHQSRWGYKTLTQMKEVISKYNQHSLPIDTIWSDLDYMRLKAIFTIDESNYPSKQFKQFLQKQNLHWIPLIDVGVYLEDRDAITKGKQMDIFIKNKHNLEYYVAKVWPGRVHFVDYLHPSASAYWQNQLDRLYKKVPFSGIWLDMNEPSNFQYSRLNIPDETYFIQHNQNQNMMTIDADLPHYCENKTQLGVQKFMHRQVHAYFGHLSTIPTHNFLKKNGRPFIISRSNSVGTGRFAGHWTGDNNAEWQFLQLSISGNFLFQIFGIPMVGADICGFHYNTTQQLCARWMQLGSLYPFARNHNEDVARSQQPYSFGSLLTKTSQIVLKQRYSLLKQLYTSLVQLNGTGSFYRPLFFQFYNDSKTLEDTFAESQFLLGNYLMSSPISQQNKQTRTVYFPGYNQVWYDITSISKNPVIKDNNKSIMHQSQSTAQIINQLPSPIPLFLRGGFMIFTNQPKLRSKFLTNEFMIIGAINKQHNSAIKGKILGFQNYNNQSNIQKCFGAGCILNVLLTKHQNLEKQQECQFALQWKGDPGVDMENQIIINKIRIFEQDTEWFYQKATIIKGKQGQILILMQKK